MVTFRKSKLTEEYLETLNLNERQMKALEFLKEHKGITSKKYANLFGITDRMARNDLRKLVVRSSINFTMICHCERQRSNLEFLSN